MKLTLSDNIEGFEYLNVKSQNPLKQTMFGGLHTNFVGKTFRKSESSAKLKENSTLNSFEKRDYSKSSIARFIEQFMFRLTESEYDSLKFNFEALENTDLRFNFGTSRLGYG